MVSREEFNQVVRQFGDVAHELEEALDTGADLNYELYKLEREVARAAVLLSNDRGSRDWIEQILREID